MSANKNTAKYKADLSTLQFDQNAVGAYLTTRCSYLHPKDINLETGEISISQFEVEYIAQGETSGIVRKVNISLSLLGNGDDGTDGILATATGRYIEDNAGNQYIEAYPTHNANAYSRNILQTSAKYLGSEYGKNFTEVEIKEVPETVWFYINDGLAIEPIDTTTETTSSNNTALYLTAAIVAAKILL